jgi:Zn-dependent M16 (insulinase) family peptidase
MLQSENDHSFFAEDIMYDFVYGDRDGSSLRRLENLKVYDDLEEWTEDRWRDLLKTWLSRALHISVLGKPSAKLAKEVKESEKARIEQRKTDLGTKKLEELGRQLDLAIQENSKPIPNSELEKWPVPGTDGINFFESKTARAGMARDIGISDNDAQAVIDKEAKGQQSFFVQFEDVPSNFVHLWIHLGTSQIPVEHKPLLPIFKELFFNTAVIRDGQRLEFEQVNAALQKDTIEYGFSSTSAVGDREGVSVQFAIEPQKYATAIGWLRDLVFNGALEEERISSTIAKLLADVPESKREGDRMLSEVNSILHFEQRSAANARNCLVQGLYFKKLKKRLKEEPAAVISWLKDIRSTLFQKANMRILVIGRVAGIEKPVQAWDDFPLPSEPSSCIMPIHPMHTFRTVDGLAPGSIGSVVIPMKTLDGSHSISTAEGLTSYSDPRLPALFVAVSFLETVEGPLWNAVRGKGYAYGCSFSRDVDGGLIRFKVYRSPDVTKAIESSRDAIHQFIQGETPVDKEQLEAAVSQIVVAFAEQQATMASAATQNYVFGVVRGVSESWDREMLGKVRLVTKEEMIGAMRDLLMPVFEPGKSNVVVTTNPNLQEVSFNAFCTMLTSSPPSTTGYLIAESQAAH